MPPLSLTNLSIDGQQTSSETLQLQRRRYALLFWTTSLADSMLGTLMQLQCNCRVICGMRWRKQYQKGLSIVWLLPTLPRPIYNWPGSMNIFLRVSFILQSCESSVVNCVSFLTGDPTVACVWRRQTFSAAVDACTPDMSLSILYEQVPELMRTLNGKIPASGGVSIVESAYAFSRMLHGSGSSSTDAFYRAFVPELGSALFPSQIELVKRCLKSERGEQDRVGATIFPGLVKVSRMIDTKASVQVIFLLVQWFQTHGTNRWFGYRLLSDVHKLYANVLWEGLAFQIWAVTELWMCQAASINLHVWMLLSQHLN